MSRGAYWTKTFNCAIERAKRAGLDPVVVVLAHDEYMLAAMSGLMRCVENRKNDKPHTYGAAPEDAEAYHVRGAIAEKSLAKHLNRFCLGRGRIGDADVAGFYECRSSSFNPPHLCIHPGDKDDAPYVSIYVCEGFCLFYGWAYGRDGKKYPYEDKFKKGRPAHWVPAQELRPMSELPGQGPLSSRCPSPFHNPSSKTSPSQQTNTARLA